MAGQTFRGIPCLTLVVLLASQCLSCAGMSRSPGEELKAMVRGFHHDMRWEYLDKVAARISVEHSTAFQDALEDMKDDLNITGWEIRRIQLTPGQNRAFVKATVHYYLMPSTVLRVEKMDQTWELVGKQWLLKEWKGGPVPFPPGESNQEDPPGKANQEQAEKDGVRP